MIRARVRKAQNVVATIDATSDAIENDALVR